MTHFSVYVNIGSIDDRGPLNPEETTTVMSQRVEALLARYDENTQVPRYKERDVYIPKALEGKGLKGLDLALALNNEWKITDPTDPEYTHVDDEGGYVWSTYNPDSKWDYWRIGGRWANGLRHLPTDGLVVRTDDDHWDSPKPVKHDELACSACPWGALDWDAIGLYSYRAGKEMIALHEGGKGFYSDAFYIDRYGWEPGESHDAFAKKYMLQDRWSQIVTPDGEWHARYRNGWWATESDHDDDWLERYQAIVQEFKDDDIIVIVDCHI